MIINLLTMHCMLCIIFQTTTMSMAAFAEHRLNESLRRSAADFPRCTAPCGHTHQVSRVVVEKVWYLPSTAAPFLAVHPAVESPSDLETPAYNKYVFIFLRIPTTWTLISYFLLNIKLPCIAMCYAHNTN